MGYRNGGETLPADHDAPPPDPARDPAGRRRNAVLAAADARRNVADGVGIALRRLRPLLPQQTRGLGHRRNRLDRVACHLLDDATCRCGDYAHRHERVPDCQPLTPENVPALSWLPPTCAYKLVAEGRDLYWWHPLVSGDPDTVHYAGISVRGRTERDRHPRRNLEDYVVRLAGRHAEGGAEAA